MSWTMASPYRIPPERAQTPESSPSSRAVIIIVLATCPLIVELARAQRWILGSILLAFVSAIVIVLLRRKSGA